MKVSNKTKILVRFDDICPTMNFVQFQKAIDLLDKYSIKPLLGVIPDCKDPDLYIETEHADFWEFVKSLQSKGYTIAMHGYQHVFDTEVRGLINNSFKSEFAGHSIDEQKEKIVKGKKILEAHGIYTDIFFAPAHSYDKNTIKALSQCGFKYMSDSGGSKVYKLFGIKLLPVRQCNIIRFLPLKYTTAIFHAHEWVREDKKEDYDFFNDLLNNKRSQIVQFKLFSELPSGINLVQRLEEKVYVFYERHIHPYLVKVYRKIR